MSNMKKVIKILVTLLAIAFELFWRLCFYTSLLKQHETTNDYAIEDKHRNIK